MASGQFVGPVANLLGLATNTLWAGAMGLVTNYIYGGGTWDVLSTNVLPSLESLSNRYDMFRIEAIDSSNPEGDTRIKGRIKQPAQ